MAGSGLRALVQRRRVNAAVGWLLLGFLVVSAAGAFVTGIPLWSLLSLAVVVLAAIPPVVHRRATAMLPWEVLVLAALPIAGRTVIAGRAFGGIPLTGRVTTYFAVAAVALVVAVELDLFTPVRMSRTFAVLFVVVATMATAGVWAELRWLADVAFGTSFLLDGRPEHAIERALMLDFVAATVVGAAAGLVFEYYIRRLCRPTDRLPPAVAGR